MIVALLSALTVLQTPTPEAPSSERLRECQELVSTAGFLMRLADQPEQQARWEVVADRVTNQLFVLTFPPGRQRRNDDATAIARFHTTLSDAAYMRVRAIIGEASPEMSRVALNEVFRGSERCEEEFAPAADAS